MMKAKLLLMLLAIALVAGAAQANLLLNPGFEEGAFAPQTVPDDWSISWSSYTSAWTWFDDADQAHGGSRYIKMATYAYSLSSAWIGQTVDVTPDQEYAFSVWAKCPVTAGTSEAWARVRWLNSEGARISQGWLPWGWDVGSNWEHVEFGTVAAPESATQAVYYLVGVLENNTIGVLFDDAYMDTPLPNFPFPAWESLVPVGDVELSWTNMDPNEPGDPMYVKVLFGSEPNETDPSYDMAYLTLDPVSGQDVTSATVNALDPNTYYWRVKSYIYGDPADGGYDINGTDPNKYPIFEGLVWSFDVVTDAPPSSVDAGVDMITWTGEPVVLDATVVDDSQSPLDYVWSADSISGTSVEFSATDVEDPTVTITKDFSVIPIVNHGFETPAFGDGGWAWHYDDQGWGYYNASNVGVWNITSDDYTDEAPEGQNVGFVDLYSSEEAGFAQVLTDTLQPNTTYILMVEVGNFKTYAWNGYKVQLLVGGTQASDGEVTGGNLLAEDNDSLNITPDTFRTSTVIHTSGGVNDPNFAYVGLPLQIRLLIPTSQSWYHADFDNVRLTVDSLRPVSDSVSTVELTLKANDEANPTYVLKDTMTIDVYDDACVAAKAAGRAAENPADFDADCDTDLADLAVMAEKWLSDTSLTEPVVKP